MTKVILDRSIFHKERFESLKNSRLYELNALSKIVICFTGDFIEETLYYSQIDLSKFGEHWHYLRSLKNVIWFKSSEDIIPLELNGNSLQQNYFIRPQENIDKLFFNSEKLVRGKVFSFHIDEMKKKSEANNKYREDFRKNVLESRSIVGKTPVTFSEYYESNIEYFVKEGLMNYHKNSTNYYNIFQSNRPECKFTEMFLKSWMAPIYLPIINHNIKVDKNDRSDSHQLAFLLWADIFVSDDKQFVPMAFELLYPSPNKLLLNSQQFIKLMNSL